MEELEAAFHAAEAALRADRDQLDAKYHALIPDRADWAGPGPDREAARARARAVSEAERATTARLRLEAMQASLLLARARAAAKLGGDGR
jgi:hypothetical protein